MKYLTAERDERGRGVDLPLLSVSAARGVVRRDVLTDEEPRAEDLSNYKICLTDDLVINRMSAYQGALGVTAEDGIVSPDYAVLRITGPHPRFVHHLVRSAWFVSEMSARLRGIGASDQGNVRTPRINIEDFGEIRVRLPELDDQRRMASFLDAETMRISSVVQLLGGNARSPATSLSGLLLEKNRALVEAVVSGQFDVSQAAR